jgi:hypothetical protein
VYNVKLADFFNFWGYSQRQWGVAVYGQGFLSKENLEIMIFWPWRKNFPNYFQGEMV